MQPIPLRWRMCIFLAPVLLAQMIRVSVIMPARDDDPEKLLYLHDPTKVVDVYPELLLAAVAIMLGTFLTVRPSGSVSRPQPGGGTVTISTSDILVCSIVQIVTFVLIFVSVVGVGHVPYVEARYKTIVAIWLPDLLAGFALTWTVIKLT
ncbi:MAG TPA: hypothetical protein VMB73_01465 [Acetobacteraceae bacterium]|jgi:hypothetical protein|nr:hypothetical protein [Acetobacteraceae bacterium]